MMKLINKKILRGIFVFLMLVTVWIVINSRNHLYSVNVIRSHQGWGYNIQKGRRIIIHQPFMPAINGQIAFRTKNSAKKTGIMVVKKLRGNQSPVINKDELNSICKIPD
jgi:hypothetical protein